MPNSHLRRCIDCGQVKHKEFDFPAVNDIRHVQTQHLRRCWACYRRILRRIDIRARIRQLRGGGLTRGGVRATTVREADMRLDERGGEPDA